MKKGIGLFLLIYSFQILAGSSGILYLRARVPASYSVKMETRGNKLVPVVHSNRAKISPRIEVSPKNNNKLISVVHP